MSEYSFSNLNKYPIISNNYNNTNNYEYSSKNNNSYSYEINTNNNNLINTNNYNIESNNYQTEINNKQINNFNYNSDYQINNNIYEPNNNIQTGINKYQINNNISLENNYNDYNNNYQTNNNISLENNYNDYNNNYQINSNNINNFHNNSYNHINENNSYQTQTIEIQDLNNDYQNLEQTNQINNNFIDNQIIINNENNILNNEYNQNYENNLTDLNNYNNQITTDINPFPNNNIIEEEQNNNIINNEDSKEKKYPIINMNNNYSVEEFSEIFKKILGNKNIESKELEDIIIKIVEKTDHFQRQQIRDFYRKFNGNLTSILKEELNGNFKESVLGSFLHPSEYDAYCLNNSFKSNSQKKELILSEIIGSRSCLELQTIKRFYSSNYHKLLRKDISSKTPSDFQKFLLSLLQCNRSTSSSPNANSCANDATDLYRAGIKRRQNDEDTFIRIFTRSSPMEITIINHFYKQQTGKGLLGGINTEFEFGKETKDLLDTIVRVLIDKEGFYAKAINDAINEGNDEKLIRVVCSRHSVDLNEIKKAYKRDYKKELSEEIKDKENIYEENWGKIIYSLVEKA